MSKNTQFFIDRVGKDEIKKLLYTYAFYRNRTTNIWYVNVGINIYIFN